MKILIIGTNRGAHYELIKQGHKVTLLSKNQTAEKDDINIGYQRLLLIDQNAPDDEYLAIAKALHSIEKFDCIHSFHDGYQVISSFIAKKLSIRCLLDGELTKRLHNKLEARQLLCQANLSNIACTLVTHATQLTEAIRQIGYPAIIKPIEGTASIGVMKVRSDDDLNKVRDTEFPLIVEKFFEGKEFSVEAFSEHGEHRVLAITEQFKIPNSFVEVGHVIPARCSDKLSNQIITYVYQVLDVLEVKDGPTHTEILINGQQIEFVESHTRTAGDEIPILVARATGFDLYDIKARQVAGERVLDKIPQLVIPSKHSAIWFKWADINTKQSIESINGILDAKELDNVHEVKLEKQIGEAVLPIQNSFDRIAYVIVDGMDSDKALNNAQQAIEKINVTFKQNK